MEFHSVWLIVGGLLFFFFFRFIYFWLHWVFIAARGLSLVAESMGYTVVVELRLLTVVASLAVEPRL